jgi:hypothetical protein
MYLLRLETLNSETATLQTRHVVVDHTSAKKRCFHEGWATWTFAQGIKLKGAPKGLRKYCQYFLPWYASFRLVHKIAKSDYWLRYVCPSVHLSAWDNSAGIRRIFL